MESLPQEIPEKKEDQLKIMGAEINFHGQLGAKYTSLFTEISDKIFKSFKGGIKILEMEAIFWLFRNKNIEKDIKIITDERGHLHDYDNLFENLGSTRGGNP